MSIQETLLQKVAQLQRTTESIQKDMQFMRKQLFGNGAIGIDEQVRKNTEFRDKMQNIDKQVEMNTKFLGDVKKLAWTFVTLVAGQIVAAVMLWVK